MTPLQPVASANAPWTRTTVGFCACLPELTPGLADALVVARAVSANAPASAPISNDLWEGRVGVRMADIRILPPSVDDGIDATAAAVMSAPVERRRFDGRA